ncbi:MAG: DNA-binding response regulator [Candidatus Rokuibacteriota bacterium]|nr:MAG: DNA-binding response regulator [Candidatus Rokubacteria bacterium]
MRILIVEDDPLLSRQLADTLARAGDAVDCASDGEEGHFLGDTEPYNAVVLDLGLPRMDGITVLKRWRAAGRTMPVLILTARGSWPEKVQGIDAGADDYLAKPFQTEELLARLRALIHRKGQVVSRSELIEHIYAQDFDRDSNTIEVFVARLRRKLGVNIIKTIRGLGYRLEEPG